VSLHEPDDLVCSARHHGLLAMSSDLTIRPYRQEDALPPITALLHAAYARLAEMGLRYTATHQSDEVTLKRLLRGFPFVAEIDGEIVATVTLYACGVVVRMVPAARGVFLRAIRGAAGRAGSRPWEPLDAADGG